MRYSLVLTKTTAIYSRRHIRATALENCIDRYAYYHTDKRTLNQVGLCDQPRKEGVITERLSSSFVPSEDYELKGQYDHYIHKDAEPEWIDIKVVESTRQVVVKGFGAFKLMPMAYLQKRVDKVISNTVYVEVITHKELEWKHSNYYGWYKKWEPVKSHQGRKVLAKMAELGLGKAYHQVPDDETAKRTIMYNSPKAYFIVATQLTRELYNRVTQLMKYGVSPYLYIEDAQIFGVQMMSPGTTQTMLDYQYYDPKGIKENRINQSPFVCEQPETYNLEGAQRIYDAHQLHEQNIWQRVMHNAQWLWTYLMNFNQESIIEKGVYSKKLGTIPPWYNTEVTPEESAYLEVYAKAYGFDLRADSETTASDYCEARHMFSNKVSGGYAESSATIWDYVGRVEKALISSRQKSKLLKLGTSTTEKQKIIEAIKWMENHTMTIHKSDTSMVKGLTSMDEISKEVPLYLDHERTNKCECGKPITITEEFCMYCDAENPDFDEFALSELDANIRRRQKLERAMHKNIAE